MSEKIVNQQVKMATRMNNVEASPLMRLSQRAEELRHAGRDVIALGVGEPDWTLSSEAQNAAFAAVTNGEIKYTGSAGNLDLREEIARVTAVETGRPFTANEVIVTPGGKFALFSLMQALLEPGAEVIIPAPYWPSYLAMVKMADAKAVVVECDSSTGYLLSAEKLSRAITPQTRMIIFNSPSNPTGAVYDRATWLVLAEVLRTHPDITILTDDLYAKIQYASSPAAPLLAVAPDLLDRTFIINGVSKAYGMTGWRLGWAVGPAHVIKKLAAYQSQSISCVSSLAQIAALTSLRGSQEIVTTAIASLTRRREIGFAMLSQIDGVRLRKPDGAFYFWADVSGLLKKSFSFGDGSANARPIDNDETLADLLLEHAGIAVVPGSHFGLGAHLRISFALDEAKLVEALRRFQEFAAKLEALPGK